MTDDKAIADKERGGDVLGTVVVILAEDASKAATAEMMRQSGVHAPVTV